MGCCPHIFCLVRRNVMNGSESLPNVSIILQCKCFSLIVNSRVTWYDWEDGFKVV